MNTTPRTYLISFVNGSVLVACSDSFTWKKVVLLAGYDKVKFSQVGYNLMHAEFCLANTVHDQLHTELVARLSKYEHFDVKVEKSGTFLASCVNPTLLVRNPDIARGISAMIRELAEAIVDHDINANLCVFAQTLPMNFQDSVS
jgi:hypothetical protein